MLENVPEYSSSANSCCRHKELAKKGDFSARLAFRSDPPLVMPKLHSSDFNKDRTSSNTREGGLRSSLLNSGGRNEVTLARDCNSAPRPTAQKEEEAA